MRAYQFAQMLYTADNLGLTRFATMQNHYNLIYREEEREMIPLCIDEGIGLIPYSPLARGFVAGNRRAEDFGETVRSKTDDLSQKFIINPLILPSSNVSPKLLKNVCSQCANRAGVGVGTARHYGSDCWRKQNATSGRCTCRTHNSVR